MHAIGVERSRVPANRVDDKDLVGCLNVPAARGMPVPLLVALVSTCLCMWVSAAQADELTQTRLLSRVVINTNNNGLSTSSATVSYYFGTTDTGGWGAPGCPGAEWTYINSTTAGAKDLLDAALSARATQRPVIFTGNCNPGNPAYFQANALVSD